MNWITFILVVVSAAINDACWTFYFIKVAEKRIIPACFWSALIILVGLYSMSSCIENKDFIIAAILGAIIGTAASVWYSKKSNLQAAMDFRNNL